MITTATAATATQTSIATALASIAANEREITQTTRAIERTTENIATARATLKRAQRLLKRGYAQERHTATITAATAALETLEATLQEQRDTITHYTNDTIRLRAYITSVTLPTAPLETPVTDTPTPTAPTVDISLPTAFCAWFDGGGLVQGDDDATDPEAKETRAAYLDGTTGTDGTTVRATATVLKVLAEFATTATVLDDDDTEDGEGLPEAAGLLLTRITTARTTLREHTARAERKRAALAADPHSRCEHRKSLTADHATDCPVYDEGLTNDMCECHYSDARCTELDTPAPVESPAAPRTGLFVMPVIDHRHRPHIDIDGTLYKVVALPPKGATTDTHTVTVTDGTNGRFPHNGGRFETTTHNGAHYAWRLDDHDWETFGKNGHQVRTEDRGHGIIAVYVKGPADDIKAIERTSRAYARNRLTFAPGMSMGPVSGGGEFRDGGATYISQDTYATQPLTPRKD
ncbi:hypothetical protein [Streptomyces sp. NPDC018055]|uniref:hypothetical protein n=1 Tax=Streptomyces sp. NPDC018055 TaxID=3365038 RepID=UPI0037907FE3